MHDVFHLPLPVLDKVLRSVLVYGFLVIALRVAGKRELSQLSTTDFVVLLAVANAVQNGIIGEDNSVTGGVLSAVTLFSLNGALAYVLFRSARARRLVAGTPSVLIEDGQPCLDALRREQITLEQLTVAVNRQTNGGIDEVDRCTLEPSGQIVVFSKPPTDSQRLKAVEEKLDVLLARLA